MPLITCPDCAKEMSDRAPACPNCGAPAAEVKWETLTIEHTTEQTKLFFWTVETAKCYFWADAIGPTGNYNAGESSRFNKPFGNTGRPQGSNKATDKAHRELIDLLVGHGWEPTTESPRFWWKKTFRRRFGSESQQPKDGGVQA